MKTPSASKECSPTEELEEYRRLCLIAAEYTRQHKKVTIACGMCTDGSSFFTLAVMGETGPRRTFDADRGISREELFRLFGEAAGIVPEPASGDDWDW